MERTQVGLTQHAIDWKICVFANIALATLVLAVLAVLPLFFPWILDLFPQVLLVYVPFFVVIAAFSWWRYSIAAKASERN